MYSVDCQKGGNLVEKPQNYQNPYSCVDEICVIRLKQCQTEHNSSEQKIISKSIQKYLIYFPFLKPSWFDMMWIRHGSIFCQFRYATNTVFRDLTSLDCEICHFFMM